MKSKATKQHATIKPIVTLLPYQREDVEADDRFRWNCWSRQSGKSFTKTLRRILRGLDRRRNQVFLSAGERQSRELMRKARQHCKALNIAVEVAPNKFRTNSTILEIILPGRTRVTALPAHAETARGFSGDVFLDEFAMHEDDRAIWSAMFPTILRGRGELDVASTPNGKQNVFFDLSQNPRFAKSIVTLDDAIEQGLDVEREELREAMGDDNLFRQEFLCEFLDESTAFLTHDQIDSCVDPDLKTTDSIDTLQKETRELFIGVDIGRTRDLTVAWVLAKGAEGFDTVAIFELSAAPFRIQFDLINELLRISNVRRCCIDAGGLGMQLAEQAAERFGNHRVEPVTFTAALKSEMAGALRIAVESQRIRIPENNRIRNDWHSVQRSMTSAGHFRLSAKRQQGSHADRFWAAVLALHATDTQEGGIIESQTISPLRFARKGAW